ncbi:hypothetical protein FACS189426_18060 [Bacteroidia bacterium]|nr:hypothetical protein FACS189426_18060 [Bacteroidia bacterium]
MTESTFTGTAITINSPSKIKIEDFIVDYDTIRLEVLDNSVLDNISLLHIMNDKFFILDKRHTSIYIFSKDGKFLSKINDQGNGPNEYVNISSFELDFRNNCIILSDSFSRRIFIYDESGNQQKVIHLEFQPATIVTQNEVFLNFYSGIKNLYDDPDMENYNLHRLDSLGNFISSAIFNETDRRINIASTTSICYKQDGTLLYQPVLGDTIYQVTGQGVKAYYTFIFSAFKQLNKKQKKNLEYLYDNKSNDLLEKEKEGYLLSWGEILDLDDYLFLGFSGWDRKVYLYYSKQKCQSITVIPEQVQGNEALKQIFMSYPKATYNDKFYISPHLMQLMEMKDDLPEGKLKTFANNTNYDSNPAIISFSIKFPDEDE